MPREFTRYEADRTNGLRAKGNALTEGRLLLGGSGPAGPPGWFDRWQLRRAMRCCAQARLRWRWSENTFRLFVVSVASIPSVPLRGKLGDG